MECEVCVWGVRCEVCVCVCSMGVRFGCGCVYVEEGRYCWPGLRVKRTHRTCKQNGATFINDHMT